MNATPPPRSGATHALALLLVINLFNYIDRQVLAAVEPKIAETFFAANDPNAMAKTGSLATAFLLSYMLLAPLFGALADRISRWKLIAGCVVLWSVASGWSGLAQTFTALLITRVFVGIGEAGYGPAAPTIIADLYPVEKRGRVLSLFYLALPVGSALGYALGGVAAQHLGWRWAFYLVVPPGLLLAAWCLFMRDPRHHSRVKDLPAAGAPLAAPGTPGLRQIAALAPTSTTRTLLRAYKRLFAIPSYVLNTAAMAAMTFAIGGIAFWMPRYIYSTRGAEFAGGATLAHINFVFGAITAVSGLLATLLGGWAGDRLRRRYANAYFLVSGCGIFLSLPATLAMLWVPFPWSWALIFVAVFFLFFNTGPSNAALANVSPAPIRGTAFALNIFLIHAFGDAISPPLIGWIAGRSSMNTAFVCVSAMMLVSSVCWFWGARYLAADTAAAEAADSAIPQVAK